MKQNPLEQRKTGTPLKEVVQIGTGFGEQILNRDSIKNFVEKPLIGACEVFWDKNIRTLESSANSKDIGSAGYIGLDFNTLSEENKIIAKQYGEPNQLYVNTQDVLSLRIPIYINTSETVEEVSRKAIEIANKFQKQKASWISGTTLQERIDQLQKNFGDRYPEAFQKEKERLQESGVWEQESKRLGHYFDSETQTSWPSEEYYKKFKEGLMDNAQ